jgi:hypothetical protein
MQATSAAAGSALTFLLTFLFNGSEPPDPVHGSATPSGVLLSDEFDDCDFYNLSVTFQNDGFCSHYSIRRVPASVFETATSRALQCATVHTTECVLNSDVGLAVPLFWTMHHGQMQAFAAPSVGAGDGKRQVRLRHPSTGSSLGTMAFNTTVAIEYTNPLTRSPLSAKLEGQAAFCAQLLRYSFSEDCWRNLD